MNKSHFMRKLENDKNQSPNASTKRTSRSNSVDTLPNGLTAKDQASPNRGFIKERVRCIAALRIDGKTTLRLNSGRWSSQLTDLLGKAERCRADGGCRFQHKFETGLAKVSMHQAKTIIHFPEQAQVIITPAINRIDLELRAAALWTYGYKETATRWIQFTSKLAGIRVRDLAEAHKAGWQVAKLHLCSDFQGLTFCEADAKNFTSVKTWKINDSPVEMTVTGSQRTTETITLGSPKSDSKVCIYSKSGHLAKVLAQSLEESCYWDVWSQQADFDKRLGVWRVELRLTGRALKLCDSNELDVSNPEVIVDESALGKLWHDYTRRIRLTTGDGAVLRKRNVDPRWERVQAIGVAGKRFKQFRARRDKCRSAVQGQLDVKFYRLALRLAVLDRLSLSGLDIGSTTTASLARMEKSCPFDLSAFTETVLAQYQLLLVEDRDLELIIEWMVTSGKFTGMSFLDAIQDQKLKISLTDAHDVLAEIVNETMLDLNPLAQRWLRDAAKLQYNS